MDPILTTSVAAIALGVAGQIVAEREHPAAVFRLAGFANGEPTLRVGDGEVPQLEHLDLLVAEGRAWEALGAVGHQPPTGDTDNDVPDGDVSQQRRGGIKP